jgi:sugar phosphate isomerase/epimerase
MNSRRKFIKYSAAGLSGIALGKSLVASELNFTKPKRHIHVFSKCLHFLNYQEMAGIIAGLGFDGADLTVRTGGHVLPENVTTDLHKAVKALRNEGVDSKMIVTNINNPGDQYTRPILKTMANLGIKYYRMGYLDYDNNKSMPDNLEEHKFTFEKLEKLNREFNVHGDYQNHSGRRVGGPVWDLYQLLKDRDPEFIGVQYDVRHATVEGGYSWPLGMRLVAPWIKTTDIKDFIWSQDNSKKWIAKSVPLGEGMVDFKLFMEIYRSIQTDAPVSIHYEYDLGGAEHGKTNPAMDKKTIYNYLSKDLIFLKELFDKYL